MPVSRSNQGKSTVKPRALNSSKQIAGSKASKTLPKRSVKKSTSTPSVSSGYSLYSSDSESGGVSSINHGLDRCAALLANILDNEESIDVASKMPPAKRQVDVTKQPLKGKPTTKGVSKLPKQSKGVKKDRQKPSTTSKHSGNSLHVSAKKPTFAGTNRPRQSKLHGDKSTQERSVPQVQATQFNDRLVSSTPDMGSPSSQHHTPGHATDDFNRIPNQQLSSSQYHDSSLEALAAQIQMLRSQAELEESLQKLPKPTTAKETSHLDKIESRLQEPSVINPSTVKQERLANNHGNEPRQLLRSLTDHLRDLNKRHQAAPAPNPLSDQSQQPIPPQVQFLTDRHRLSTDGHHVQAQLIESHPQQSGDAFEAKSTRSMPAYQQDPSTQFEPPESVNTSFIPEYHQLPDQTVDIIPSRERILKQLEHIKISSTVPVTSQNRHQDIQDNIPTNQQKSVNDTNSTNPIHAHHMKGTQSNPSLTVPLASQLHQDGSQMNEVVGHQQSPIVRGLEIESENLMQGKIQTLCIGTQTHSPPADKGVQTSHLPSPSSPDVKSSQSSSSSSDGQPSDSTQGDVRDTPRPQHKSPGKRSASWEQMRVLRYLVGELRVAVGDLGEDKEVGRLLTEIQDCLDTLQYLPLDLQAEVGLALQPLRSENSQLRRRLRIANQQIRRLEKGPDKENMEPLVDVEVLTLQSLNAKLQKDLREEVNKQKKWAENNAEYKTAVDNMKQKHQDLMALLQQKDNHQLKSHQEWLKEKSDLTSQLDQMQSQLNDLQLKVEAVNKENRILQLSLQQRDAEIIRLKQDPESNYFEHKYKVYPRGNDSISESDDDATPKASPHQSPHSTRPHQHVTSPTRDALDFAVQHTSRKPETSRLQNSTAFTQTSNPPQSFANKRVTFAQYLSSETMHNDYNSEMTSRHSRTLTNDKDSQESPVHPDQWETGGIQLPSAVNDVDPVEDSGRSGGSTDPLHVLHSGPADKDFSMRKFLQLSRHFSSGEDVVETDSSDNIKPPKLIDHPLRDTTTSQSNIYSRTYTSNHPSHSLAIHLPVDRKESHKPVFQRRKFSSGYDSQTQPSHPVLQHTTFQGSALDVSVSGIDTESTQSSVTSQYEAQFQLGLASLDTEIAKLQNSLRSMDTGKPIQNFNT